MSLSVTRSVVLTPGSISACPGDEIVVTCSESESETIANGNRLRWEITLREKTVPMIELTLSDHTNDNRRQEAGVKFYSKLTSYSPLIATLWTTAHPALDGAIVTCTTSITMEASLVIEVTDLYETGNNTVCMIVIIIITISF